MISKQTTEDARGLRPLIQQLLDEWCKRHKAGFKLKVSEEVVQQDEWTYYIVVPDQGEIRAYDYATALSEVEAALRDQHTENVLLVPALPD